MDLNELVQNVEELVSLPAACARLTEMVDDPSCSAQDMGRVINQDVALTARLLRIANSPMYGLSTKVDTVTRAVTVLGMKQVRDLVLASAAIRAFDGIPNTLVSMHSFWEHSIFCALCARNIAMECLRDQREAVFVAGLLHDMGKLVLYNQLPELSRRTLESSNNGKQSRESQTAEREIIGFSHADVGGELAKRWSLPLNLQECIAYHHEPDKAEHHHTEVAIIHMANSLAILAARKSENPDKAPAINDMAWKLTGLDKEMIPVIIAGAQAQISSAIALLIPR
ncbi:HDOD domain-containing protein [Kaarinaea lacus]